MTKFTKWKKWQKLIQGLYSNHVHIHLKTIEKTCAKFQKDQYKIVWGVALTRYPLSIHFHRIWGQKMTKFTKWKKWQKLTQGLYPNHMHIFRPWKKRAKFQKDQSCAHKVPTVYTLKSKNGYVHKVEKVTKYRSNFGEVDVAPEKNWKMTNLTMWKSDKN